MTRAVPGRVQARSSWSALRRAAIAAIAVIATAGSDLRSARADTWLGRDKALHFGASAGLAIGGYAVSSFWLEERWARAASGAAFSLAIGAGKEGLDALGDGDPSWKDAAWDGIGTAVGIAAALVIDVLVERSSGR